MTYDVAIIGTGPAGMFVALEIVAKRPDLKLVMIERGRARSRDDRTNIACGWGGAGAFSDGKLNWTYATGGHLLAEVLGEDTFEELTKYVDSKYLEFGGASHLIDPNCPAVDSLKRQAYASGLALISFPIRHLGTEKCFEIVENIRRYLLDKSIKIILNNGAAHIEKIPHPTSSFKKRGGEEGDLMEVKDGGGFILTLENGDKIEAAKVVAAVGRSGADWLAQEAKNLGLGFKHNGVDIGVRVEVRSEILEHLTRNLYEAKIIYESPTFRDRVRTFCMCPYGFVGIEKYPPKLGQSGEFRTVNGHSYAAQKSENTNFAVLVTQNFTEPFDNPLDYGRYVAEAANRLAGGSVLVQRLGDLKSGRRSTVERINKGFVRPTLKDAVPGDLSLAMYHRQLTDILEMIEAMEKLAPGVASDHTLFYGNEVKFYSVRIDADNNFQTNIPGLYVAGDGSGYTRGLLQASMQGVVVGRHIASIC